MNLGRLAQKIRGNKILRIATYPIAKICSFALATYTQSHPACYPSHNHKRLYGRSLDLTHPQSLHEKIFWMLYHTDTDMWTRLTDKVTVREYVKQVGLKHILNEVYAIYDYMPDIQTLFKNLPDSFVIKTNHCAAGEGIALVSNLKTANKKRIYKKIRKAFNTPYGKRSGQPHYAAIKPKIIVEKYLINDVDDFQILPDYKFLCFHGEPQLINSIGNRDVEKHTYLNHYYTLDWQRIQWDKDDHTPDLIRPKSLDRMIEYAKILSKPFAFVRVDFYEVHGEPVFGEMTFTPGFDGIFGTYGDKVLKLGDRIDLSQVQASLNTNNSLIYKI